MGRIVGRAVRWERETGGEVQRERRHPLVVGVRRSRAGRLGGWLDGSCQLERERGGGKASRRRSCRSGQRGPKGWCGCRDGGRPGGLERGAGSGRAGAFARHDAERRADCGRERWPEPIRSVVTGRRRRRGGRRMGKSSARTAAVAAERSAGTGDGGQARSSQTTAASRR